MVLARALASLVVAGAVAAGCAAGDDGLASPWSESPTPTASGREPTDRAGGTAILFLGNSHTSRHDVPGTVVAMLRAGRPSIDARAVTSPDWMLLNERGSHEPSLALVSSRRWSHVVLQAQNYSSSGRSVYPTTGAEALVRLAAEHGARPVLFAEWPRRGIDETGRIVETYGAIADAEPACLPPIPEAFDLAAARHPDLALHDADGNHSSAAGAFLASLILYAAISGHDVAGLPAIDGTDVAGPVQSRLRQVAQDALERIPATRHCPPR